MKNENLLTSLKYQKVEQSNDLDLNLHYNDKFSKDFANIGLAEDHIRVNIRVALKLTNNVENIKKIDTINALLVELIKDQTCQHWLGLDQ